MNNTITIRQLLISLWVTLAHIVMFYVGNSNLSASDKGLVLLAAILLAVFPVSWIYWKEKP